MDDIFNQKQTAKSLFENHFSPQGLKTIYETSIQGSKAVGKDGIKRGQFEKVLDQEIDLIIENVNKLEYTFTGYKEKLISKGAYKNPRQISIPTFRDRLTLRGLYEVLIGVFPDAKIDPPYKFITDIRNHLQTVGKDHSFLRMDVQNFYPSISHEILMERLRSRIRSDQILQLAANAIKTPTGIRNCYDNQTTKGVPQGLSISNIASSLYLLNLDNKYKKRTTYFRYVDDILIICPSSLSSKIYKDVYVDLKKLDLASHTIKETKNAKSTIQSLESGIDYLGFSLAVLFDVPDDKKVSVEVRESSFKKMFKNIMNVFTSNKHHKNIERFIFRLNLKISGCIFDGKRRGWMFFFSQTRNVSQLKRLDAFVFKMLKKYGLLEHSPRIKTFTKSFHEIIHNYNNSDYFENFDTYNVEQKIRAICLVTGKPRATVESWDIDYLNEQFKKCALKEVAQLEKDLKEAFS